MSGCILRVIVRDNEAMFASVTATQVLRTRHQRDGDAQLRIALVAHDDHKEALLQTIVEHRDFLGRQTLYATSGTGQAIKNRYGLSAQSVGHGPTGGDVRLAHLVLDGEIDAVIFLRSCTMVQGHEDDIRMLVRVCHMADCILATNFATARLVLDGLAAGHSQ